MKAALPLAGRRASTSFAGIFVTAGRWAGTNGAGPVATRRWAADWRKAMAPSSVATSAWTAPDSMSWRSSSFAPFHRSSARNLRVHRLLAGAREI